MDVWGRWILLSIHSGFEFPKEVNKVGGFSWSTSCNPFIRSVANRESKVMMTDVLPCIQRKSES